MPSSATIRAVTRSSPAGSPRRAWRPRRRRPPTASGSPPPPGRARPPGSSPAAAISRALASSMPVSASTGDPGQRLGLLDGQLLDLHATLARGHGEVGAVGPVEQDREVVLLLDRRGRGEHHAVHGVALDVHAEDLPGDLLGFVGRCASFTPPALPRPPVLTCALTTTRPPPVGSSRSAAARASSGVVGHRAAEHRDAVLARTCRVPDIRRDPRVVPCRLGCGGAHRWPAAAGERYPVLEASSPIAPRSAPTGLAARRARQTLAHPVDDVPAWSLRA